MMGSHHRNWFPLILVGLTLSLLFAVVLIMQPGLQQTEIESTAEPAITAEDYQDHAKIVVHTMEAGLEAVTTDEERLKLVRDAQTQLLALVVPASHRDVHLEAVIALNLMADGYTQGTAELITEGQTRLTQIKEQNDWLD